MDKKSSSYWKYYSLCTKRKLSTTCTKIEPDGIGSLALAFEQLKTKLQTKGYFEQSIKKALQNIQKNCNSDFCDRSCY